jgi:hypothetical protein
MYAQPSAPEAVYAVPSGQPAMYVAQPAQPVHLGGASFQPMQMESNVKYGQPPQPQYVTPGAVMTSEVQGNWKIDLFQCGDFCTCLYAWCCTPCAMGKKSTVAIVPINDFF